VSMQNPDVAEIFEKVADLVEIEGENRFRIRGYWGDARTVGGYSRTATSARCWRREPCSSFWVWSGWATASTRSCGAGGTRTEGA
jgi:hypothetical protein